MKHSTSTSTSSSPSSYANQAAQRLPARWDSASTPSDHRLEVAAASRDGALAVGPNSSHRPGALMYSSFQPTTLLTAAMASIEAPSSTRVRRDGMMAGRHDGSRSVDMAGHVDDDGNDGGGNLLFASEMMTNDASAAREMALEQNEFLAPAAPSATLQAFMNATGGSNHHHGSRTGPMREQLVGMIDDVMGMINDDSHAFLLDGPPTRSSSRSMRGCNVPSCSYYNSSHHNHHSQNKGFPPHRQ